MAWWKAGWRGSEHSPGNYLLGWRGAGGTGARLPVQPTSGQIVPLLVAPMITMAEAFEAHQPYLLRVAYGLTGNPETAADLVQDMWVRALRRWSQTDDRNLRGYLSLILHRLFIDDRKAQRNKAVSLDSVPDWADDGNPYSDYVATPISLDTIVESRERWRLVVVAVRTLPKPEQRAVASVVAGAHHQPNAQRVALHRARKHLREAV